MSQSESEKTYGIKPSDPEIYRSRRIDEVARRWNAKAARWDSDLEDPDCHLNAGSGYETFLNVAVALCEADRKLCGSGTLLDLGCGTGLVAERLSKFFKKVIGVDVSQEMLNVGRDRKLVNAEWWQGDVFEGAWISAEPVAIVSRGVLLSHYGESLGAELLRAAATACDRNGFVLLDFLSAEAPASVVAHTPNKSHFACDQVQQMALAAGFGSCNFYGGAGDRVRFAALSH